VIDILRDSPEPLTTSHIQAAVCARKALVLNHGCGAPTATKASIQLARDEFNATHRPDLRVRFVTLVDPEKAINPPLIPGAIQVDFEVYNAGATTALVTESNIRVDRYYPGEWPT
jgi:hypothetical protein